MALVIVPSNPLAEARNEVPPIVGDAYEGTQRRTRRLYGAPHRTPGGEILVDSQGDHGLYGTRAAMRDHAGVRSEQHIEDASMRQCRENEQVAERIRPRGEAGPNSLRVISGANLATTVNISASTLARK